MQTRAAANSLFHFIAKLFRKILTNEKRTKHIEGKKIEIEKKSSTRHIFSHPAAGQETNFFLLRVASEAL